MTSAKFVDAESEHDGGKSRPAFHTREVDVGAPSLSTKDGRIEDRDEEATLTETPAALPPFPAAKHKLGRSTCCAGLRPAMLN